MSRFLRHLTMTRKLLLSTALVVCAASIAGLGTYATWTSSTTPVSHTISTGTVSIVLGATGASTNRLTVGATGVAPGDTIQRSVDLSNNGTIDLASITLTTTAPTSSALDTDTTNGLQMKIESCSAAGWVESLTPPYTYTCAGTIATVLASRPVIGANLALSNLAAVTAGQSDHMRVTLTLPSTADNTVQNKTSTISYVFTGTQRAATNK
jgi:spore coat-associated protein N